MTTAWTGLMVLFLSYRRNDTEGYSGRIYDHLERKLGADEIFLDVGKIDPGQDFRSRINHELQTAYAVLVIIGPAWVSTTGADGQRRLDDPEDPVRIEIETALQLGKKIIPVLCGGARMPSPQTLPETIRAVSYLNALSITSAKFRSDMIGLESAIDAAKDEFRKALGEGVEAVEHSPLRSYSRHDIDPTPVAGGTRPHGLGDRIATADLGAYRYDDIAQYEGAFLFVRNDFTEPDQLHCYAMKVVWDVQRKALVIRHRGVAGSAYQQFGIIAFAQNEKYLSIDSGTMGWRQLAILERMDFRRIMHGALFTLGSVGRRAFAPMIAPVVLIGYEGPERETRRVVSGDEEFQIYSEHLAQARRDCILVV